MKTSVIEKAGGSYRGTRTKFMYLKIPARRCEEDIKEVIYNDSIEKDDLWAYLAYKIRRQLIKYYLKKYCCGSSIQNENTKKKKKEDLETLKSRIVS